MFIRITAILAFNVTEVGQLRREQEAEERMRLEMQTLHMQDKSEELEKRRGLAMKIENSQYISFVQLSHRLSNHILGICH